MFGIHEILNVGMEKPLFVLMGGARLHDVNEVGGASNSEVVGTCT